MPWRITLALLCCLPAVSGSAPPPRAPCGPAAGAAPAAPGSLYDRVRALYPEQIPPFIRVGFRKYDQRGENVSVGYNRFFLLATTVTAFTAYFYPLPAARGNDPLAEHLEVARREVLKAHPGAEVVASADVTAAKKGRTYKGRRLTFRYDAEFGPPGKRQTVLSDLYLFRDGKRVVKYRVTFPLAEEKTEREHVEKLVAALPWPD